MFQRRRQLSAVEKAANTAHRAAKAAKAMTCQCCVRQIFAETGTIAHHGYERPGYGYQTASCMGARYLPFEVDRARLGDLIQVLKKRLADQRAMRKAVAQEKHPVTQTKLNYRAKREDRRQPYPTVHLEFTRKTFKAVIAANTGDDKVFDSYTALVMNQRGFDEVLTAELDHRDQQIKMTVDHLRECQVRYDAWKPTHRRVNDQWVKL
jgi:hypothetical protein